MTHVFFTDRDLGNEFAEKLRAAGLQVEKHADHFPPGCPDDQWLTVVGQRGWVAITHDARIRYKPNELAAVVRNRLRLLVIVGKAPLRETRRFVPPDYSEGRFVPGAHGTTLHREGVSTSTGRHG